MKNIAISIVNNFNIIGRNIWITKLKTGETLGFYFDY